MKAHKPVLLYVLIVLSIEKVIQHMVVSYAFYVDLGGIRTSVVVDHRILMISGFIVGILFLVNIPYLYQQRRFSFRLLFGLALFDFFGEFAAQGTLLIDITISFVVALAIIIILLISKKQFT
jgi:hypothetical protein